VTDWLSVGAGPTITYGTLDWKLSAPLPAPPTPPGTEGGVEFDDLDDWAAAAIAGVLLTPMEELRIGIVYQSETKLKLSGKTDLPRALPAINTELELPLAQAVRADVFWQATDDLALLFGAAWENWDTANTVPLRLDRGTASVPLGMKDTWKIRGGVHYRLNEKWLLQTGLSYDSSALNKSDRLTALPIDKQWRFGVGTLHDWSENTRIGLAFEYLNLGKGRIDSSAVKGKYKRNEIFFFVVNVNFAKLPWDGKLSF
jgi:long-chain fatty acid transport protein